MKRQTLVPPKFPFDGSGYDDQRAAYEKSNSNFDYLFGLEISSIDFLCPDGFLLQSQVTSGTINSITDTTQSWEVDEWKDKIVKIYKNGESDFVFAIIESNNENTLFFDDDLIMQPCPECVYRIIHTLVIEPEKMPVITAIDSRDGQCGVILPKSTPEIERRYAHIYLERAPQIQETTAVPIMARGADRQGGVKYGYLEDRNEGVRLYAHQWQTPHWDIISAYNITRFASAYWSVNVPITFDNNVYGTPAEDDGNVVTDFNKRFIPIVRDGVVWWRYVSLLPNYFKAIFNANIEKVGSVGEITISWRKRDSEGNIEDLAERISETRFGAGSGKASIQVGSPVFLQRNDEVTPILLKTGGTFTLDAGSYLEISQR